MASWSVITREQLGQHLVEAAELAQLVVEECKRRRLNPLSGAIAGVLLIKSLNTMLRGDLRWWAHFLVEGIEGFVVPFDGPPPNIQRGGKG